MSQILCQFTNLTQQFDQRTLFAALSGTLSTGLTGLVGRNGQGKSVLLTILSHAQLPTTGSVSWSADFHRLNQLERLAGPRLADALGIGDLYDCFQRIQLGDMQAGDLDRVDGLWHLPAEWEQLLASAALSNDLSAPVEQLSGGEQTRLALCRAFLNRTPYLLLDEPSNHLDRDGRDWLIDRLTKHAGGALIVTHDRELLAKVDRILELSEQGLTEYGGNYDIYQSIRSAQLNAVEQQLAHLEKTKRQQLSLQQASLEKSAQRKKQGEQQRRTGSQSKLLMDAKQNRAEGSLGKLKQAHQQRNSQLQTELKTAQATVEQLKVQALYTSAPPNRSGLRIHITELCLPYGHQEPISLTVQSGEHWHIGGGNGSGKSTLLKILAGLEKPRSGTCDVHGNCVYLDQHFSLLDPARSALENLQDRHPDRTESSLRTELAGLRLIGDKALTPVAHLSGGERLKVALIATLTESETHTPDILLLDEPDNHLDLDSKQLLEKTLVAYTGTLLVVSHDISFVEALNIQHQLSLQ